MNIRSAELLNQSLQNAADNIYRNRALAATMREEMARNAVEQSFRNAMMRHYTNIEQKQADAADRQAGVQQQEQQQSGIAQKQDFLKAAMQLNATGQLSPAGLKRVNDWLSSDPDLSRTGIQLSTPANPSADPNHREMALANALGLRQQYQDKYDAETDPGKRAEYGKVLEDIDASLGGKRSGNVNPDSRHAGKPGSDSAAAAGTAAGMTPGTGAAMPVLDANVPASPSPAINPLSSSFVPATPPASHIAYLRANPWTASQFDEKYGPGASAKYLKQQQQPPMPIPGGGGLPISLTNTPPDFSGNGE